MTLTEYADVLNVEIELIYYPNQNNRWVAFIKGAEVKDNQGDFF